MQVFNIEFDVGDCQDVGGLGVFPLTGSATASPPYLTGPEAFEEGLIEVSELDPPEVPSPRSPTSPTCQSSSSRAKCWSVATRTGR